MAAKKTQRKKQASITASEPEKAVHTLTSSTEFSLLQMQAIEDSIAQSETFEPMRYGFRLGSINLLTPAEVICEVLDLPHISLLPNTAAWFTGLINLRGNLIPVFDLASLLNDESAINSKQANHKMLVINSGEQALAVIIDGLPQTVPAKSEEIEPPPIADHARDFIIKAYHFQQKIWIDLNLEAYLMSLRHRIVVA